MTTQLSASGADRSEQWRQVLSDSFVPVELLPPDSRDVSGSVSSKRAGNLFVSDVTSSAIEITRHARMIGKSGTEYLHVAVSRRGYGVLSQDGRQACMRPGEPVIYETARPFRVKFDEPWQATVLTVPRDMVAMTSNESSGLTARPLSRGSRMNDTVTRAILDMADLIDGVPAALAPRLLVDLTDLALALVHGDARRQAQVADLTTNMNRPTAPRRLVLLAQVKDYIDENLPDPALSPSIIAAANHISLRYLYALFADEPDSVSGYVRRRRLRRCAQNLSDPNLVGVTVAILARRAGFADLSGFGRAFKSTFGHSASSYRSTALSQLDPAKTTSPLDD